MKPLNRSSIKVGGRPSPLSIKQLEEVEKALPFPIEKILLFTEGDKNKTSSLRPLEKTNFFTDALDRALLEGKIDVAIHSAKDLPDPLPEGIEMVALTVGKDPRDALVFRAGETLRTLPLGALIATSSERREESVKKLRDDLRFCDVRGTIAERLELLEKREADGVVVALAALIRLELTHLPHLILEGETTPLQGKLAILARSNDGEMKSLFSPLDSR